MSAPKGNQFWKLRAKHGRDKIFSSPEELWNAACEYFESVDNNPIVIQDNKGTKNVNEVELIRPYSWSGLEVFLDIYSLRDYKNNPEYKDFSQIIHKIGKIIESQQFEGATVGIFKENIIARTLGLTDKNILDHKSSDGSMSPKNIDLSKLSNKELEQYRKLQSKLET